MIAANADAGVVRFFNVVNTRVCWATMTAGRDMSGTYEQALSRMGFGLGCRPASWTDQHMNALAGNGAKTIRPAPANSATGWFRAGLRKSEFFAGGKRETNLG